MSELINPVAFGTIDSNVYKVSSWTLTLNRFAAKWKPAKILGSLLPSVSDGTSAMLTLCTALVRSHTFAPTKVVIELCQEMGFPRIGILENI